MLRAALRSPEQGPTDALVRHWIFDMRLWTIHPIGVMESLQNVGTLRVSSSYYHNMYVPWQYEWLAERLVERVPGYFGGLPWWLYCSKPDLRCVRHHYPRGAGQVRLELDTQPAAILPCWAWDVVHCGKYLSRTFEQHSRWHRRMRASVRDVDAWPLPEPRRSELEASWLCLFDKNLPRVGWQMDGTASDDSQEAVIEMLSLSDIVAVTHFHGTSRATL